MCSDAVHPTPSTDSTGSRGKLPAWKSVLAVVAHPDDESFGLGAILDTFVRQGAAVSVLCLTKGEASTLGAHADLSQMRAAELTNAAKRLGIGSAVLLDYRDGLLPEVEETVLVSEILHEVRERPVDGLVVFDPSGITGHPDHTAATFAALLAARRLGLPVLGWTLPTEVARRLNEEYRAGFVGHGDDEVDFVISVDRERQRSACLCHQSQATPGSVLWRRLDLLGDHEALRWLRRSPSGSGRPDSGRPGGGRSGGGRSGGGTGGGGGDPR